jgi:hypothetical protein
MKHVATIFASLACVSAAATVGCQAPLPSTVAGETEAARNYQGAWRASQEVLRDYGWRIDRVDRRDGLITTFPMTGMTAGEPWRRDAATLSDLNESTLQTIYRRAVVRIRRSAEGDEYIADVVVYVSRSNRPQPQVTNTSEAYEMFRAGATARARMTPGYATSDESDPTTLAPDAALAAQIEQDIRRRADEIRPRVHGAEQP